MFEEAVAFRFEAIGTTWDIRIEPFVGDLGQQELLRAIQQRIEIFDKNYSRFRDDSFVSLAARKPGTYTLPEDAEPLFDLYSKLSEVTRGKVNPLIGHLLEDTGYDAQYSLKPKKLRPVPQWSETAVYTFPTLTLNKEVLIDIGAAGKGYLIDIIGELLQSNGLENFIINAGGDILCRGVTFKDERIGLEHPDYTDQAIGIATIYNQSICGSAGNRRAWEGFNHILDPILKTSPSHIKAVWVVAETALLADGLTTALYFSEPSGLLEFFSFEYAIIYKDNSVNYSSHFPAEFFT